MKEVKEFLKHFPGLITFQTFHDKDKNSREVAKIFHGLDEANLRKCGALNKKGAGVFFMVNRGDGLGREAKNVVQVRAVFLDLDSDKIDTESVLSKVASSNLTPHFVINSSPNNYHLYFKVKPSFPLSEFSKIQESLAKEFNTDKVSDLPRVMRIPGFYHQKREPFLVRIEEISGHDPYSFDDFLPYLSSGNRPKARSGFDASTVIEGVDEGQRNTEIFKYACSRLARGLNESEVWPLVQKFASECNPPLTEKEARICFKSALKYQGGGQGKVPFFKGRDFIPSKLVDYILEPNDLFHDGQSFYQYNGNGLWQEIHENQVGQQMENVLGERARRSRIQDSLKLLEYRVFKDHIKLEQNYGLVNLKNGMLDYRTKKLLPHDKRYYSRVQIPIEYDPDADYPRFKRFLEEIFFDDPEKAHTIQDFAGYCLFPKIFIHSCLFFMGIGQNGKSVLINTLTKIIGKENTSAVELSQFSNRFLIGVLRNKLLNVSTEVKTRSPVDDSTFKSLVAGDLVQADVKFKNPITFRPICKYIFSMNDIPIITDKSYAFQRRLIIVRFNQDFSGEKDDKKLEDKLEQELPGILNWCLEGLDRVLKNKDIFVSDQMENDKKDFIKQLNPLLLFVEERCLIQDGSIIEKGQLYFDYDNWSKNSGLRPLSKVKFYRQLLEDFPTVKEDTFGKRTFKGIGLRTNYGWKQEKIHF